MKGFVANVAPERLLTGVGQPVVLIVALLMKPFAAEFADIRTIAEMDSHVRVQGGASVEGLSTGVALVRLLRRVNDLVAAKS